MDKLIKQYISLEPEVLADIRTKMKNNLWIRLSWLTKRMPQMKILHAGPLLYADSDTRSAILNVACGVPISMEDTQDVSWHYIRRNLPATWWLPTDITTPASWWLAESGWSIDDVLIDMALQPGPDYKINFKSPPELEVVVCETEKHVTDLGLVIASQYSEKKNQEGKALAEVYKNAADLLLKGEDGYKAWVGYVDGKPVSTIAAIEESNMAGLYGLATDPDHRHKHYSKATFFKALEHVLGNGCELVTLQAASSGVTIYNEAGFIPINQFVLWNNKPSL